MTDNDAIAALAISEGIDRLVDEVACDEAVVTSAMVLALARRLAQQANGRPGVEAGVKLVCNQLAMIVAIHIRGRSEPLRHGRASS